MATIYSFGGERSADGKAHPITSNDRKFNCEFGSCDVAPTTLTPVIQKDLFNLDFELLNVDVLRNNLSTASTEISNAHRSILQWFTDLESSFAIRVQTGEIPLDASLFQSLNVLVPKFQSAKRALDIWYTNFIEMSTDLSDLLSDYDGISAKLKALSTQNTTSSIQESVTTLAKKNMSKSKSIDKAISKILLFDASIRNQIHSLKLQMDQLTSGILRYGDNQILNLNDMATLLESYSRGGSPLSMILNQFARVINTTPLNFTLKTRPPELLPTVDFNSNKILKGEIIPAEEVLEKLNAFKDTTMYTQESASIVDNLKSYIDNQYKTNPLYSNMITIIESIKSENNPLKFLTTLRSKAVDSGNIYINIDTIQKTIRKLPADLSIYRENLNEILQQAVDTATNLVEKMEVEIPK